MLSTPASIRFSKPRGFVVLEGVNGAGKSTLQARLKAFIEARNVAVVSTFEPGATAQGKELRRLLLDRSLPQVSPLSELLLFAADRHEHVTQIIRPALAENKIVISDRYLYSTIAFQGYGRGLSRPTIDSLNDLAIDGTMPDVVILLDLDPKEGLARAQRRTASQAQASEKGAADAFESEAMKFHERLRNGFLELARTRPEPFVVLDAAKGPDDVFLEASKVIAALLAAKS